MCAGGGRLDAEGEARLRRLHAAHEGPLPAPRRVRCDVLHRAADTQAREHRVRRSDRRRAYEPTWLR